MIQNGKYIPVLKWRQGEYQALVKLGEAVKSNIIPLIVIPPIEFDFDERRPKKNIDEHLEKFGKRYNDKWGERPALIDMHESLEEELMHDGEMPIQFIMNALDKFSSKYAPVLSPSKGDRYIEAIKKNIDNLSGVAIRITLSELARSDLNKWLSKLLSKLDVLKSEVDLVIDLVRPDTFMPYSGFGKLVSHYITSIAGVDDFASLTVIGTSLNLKEIRKPGGEFDRHEWIFYKSLIESHYFGDQIPAFGDYVIETPEFQDIDFRLMNPAGKIIYTCDEVWLVSKGGSFRNDRSQMIGHCEKIRGSSHYSGRKFSWGDAKIDEAARGKAANFGNLATWKEVGVSHHLTKVVQQLANYFGY